MVGVHGAGTNSEFKNLKHMCFNGYKAHTVQYSIDEITRPTPHPTPKKTNIDFFCNTKRKKTLVVPTTNYHVFMEAR